MNAADLDSPAASRNPLDWAFLAAQGEPPSRRWAVNGWLGFGHCTLLVGPGGIGKTLLAQQLASSLALGRDFVDTVRLPLKVLMWACEDDADELWRRQVAIARSLDVELEEFNGALHIVPRHGLENTLVSLDHGELRFTARLEELRQQTHDLGALMVVLDNAAQLFGANENDRGQVTRFLNYLVGALPGCVILLLAHPARGAGSEFSGSSAWENASRTRLYLGDRLPDEKVDLDAPPAEDVRFLSRRKANYSSKDYRRFTYQNGVLVPDAVEVGGGMVNHLRDQRAERVVIDGLRRLQGLGVRATDGNTSPAYLPRVLIDYKLGEGLSKRELAEASRRAILDGKLIRGVVGKYPGNRSPMFGLMVAE